MGKINVAILYGGRSVEHGVSVNSAKNIFEFIDRKKFNPIPIGITQKGKWYHTKTVSKSIQKGKPLSIQLDPKQPILKSGAQKNIGRRSFYTPPRYRRRGRKHPGVIKIT